MKQDLFVAGNNEPSAGSFAPIWQHGALGRGKSASGRTNSSVGNQQQKARKPLSFRATKFLVAGAGFEPTTSGL